MHLWLSRCCPRSCWGIPSSCDLSAAIPANWGPTSSYYCKTIVDSVAYLYLRCLVLNFKRRNEISLSKVVGNEIHWHLRCSILPCYVRFCWEGARQSALSGMWAPHRSWMLASTSWSWCSPHYLLDTSPTTSSHRYLLPRRSGYARNASSMIRLTMLSRFPASQGSLLSLDWAFWACLLGVWDQIGLLP